MGPPTSGAVAAVNKLYQEGHQIFIFTAREVQKPPVKKAVEDWLDYFKIPYHGITNVKQSWMDVFIDNRSLHYEDWAQVYGDLHKIQSHWKNWSDGTPEQGMIEDITKFPPTLGTV